MHTRARMAAIALVASIGFVLAAAGQEPSKGEKILADKTLFAESFAKSISPMLNLTLQMKPGGMTVGWLVPDPQPSIQDVEKTYGKPDKVEDRKKDVNNLPADSVIHWYGRIGLAVAKEAKSVKVYWVLAE